MKRHEDDARDDAHECQRGFSKLHPVVFENLVPLKADEPEPHDTHQQEKCDNEKHLGTHPS